MNNFVKILPNGNKIFFKGDNDGIRYLSVNGICFYNDEDIFLDDNSNSKISIKRILNFSFKNIEEFSRKIAMIIIKKETYKFYYI